MKPEFKVPLLEALRSGILPKGEGSLKSSKGFCCLGVGAKIFKDIFETIPGVSILETKNEIRIFYENSDGEIIYKSGLWPESICHLVGISRETQEAMAEVNDLQPDGGFDLVVEYIEADFPDLEDFQPYVLAKAKEYEEAPWDEELPLPEDDRLE